MVLPTSPLRACLIFHYGLATTAFTRLPVDLFPLSTGSAILNRNRVANLIQKGLLYRPTCGRVAFTTPLFGAFLRRREVS